MTKAHYLSILALVTLMVGMQGCGVISERNKLRQQPPEVLLDRYELHDIYNGPYHGTALLDKQTGEVWTLATTSKGTTVTGVDFERAYVLPQPQAQPCPPNDPIGLFQSQACTPLPPKGGKTNAN